MNTLESTLHKDAYLLTFVVLAGMFLKNLVMYMYIFACYFGLALDLNKILEGLLLEQCLREFNKNMYNSFTGTVYFVEMKFSKSLFQYKWSVNCVVILKHSRELHCILHYWGIDLQQTRV